MCTDIVDQGRRSPEIRGRENLSSITDLFTGLSSGVMLIFKKKEKKTHSIYESKLVQVDTY